MHKGLVGALTAIGLVMGTASIVVADPGPATTAASHMPAPAEPANPISDPLLITSIASARETARRTNGTQQSVPVEVLTSSGDAVAQRVTELGGVVTGSVPGELVQVSVPAAKVAALALSDGVAHVQAPRRVQRPEASRPRRTDFGPTTGQQPAVTNAASWQAAGITGNVRVGIVDFFDLGLWNTAEQGPRPDTQPAAVPSSSATGRLFCRDTSGFVPNYCPVQTDGVNNGDGNEHGVAVSEVVKDVAPGAELYLATAGTTADLMAAIDWFAANDVHIVTRSLGAPYDGPGDGTGPLDAVVDHAASRGITWFNSAGNDGIDTYGRYVVTDTIDGYVDFGGGDTYLRIDGEVVIFDGVRWGNDWNLPTSERTDYAIEVYLPTSCGVVGGQSNNPPVTLAGSQDANQTTGAPPLEAVDTYFHNTNNCPNGTSSPGVAYLRIKRNAATPVGPKPDVVEVKLFTGLLEIGRYTATGSAAVPVVDSRNKALVAVGAIDPAEGGTIAYYSSQGPTNDGRVKPDVSAPSCVTSTIYNTTDYGPGACFNGTSAASPATAALAALLLERQLALPGTDLAALVEHYVVERGAPGKDNVYGTGEVRLPAAPTATVSSTPGKYVPITPTRLLDTRNSIGRRTDHDIIDVAVLGHGVPAGGVSAVAVNLTVIDAAVDYVQALPTLAGTVGAFSTLNVASGDVVTPNFSIVPLGEGGSISVYLPSGGHVLIDVLGYFTPTGATSTDGRYEAIAATRLLDTRLAPGGAPNGPVPAGWAAHRPKHESVPVPIPWGAVGVDPATVSAVVVNVVATSVAADGYLQALPSGVQPGSTSTVNYAVGADRANLAIVALGAGGGIEVWVDSSTDLVVDLLGVITNGSAPDSAVGRFVPITPGRALDTRQPPGSIVAASSTRTAQITGLGAPTVPAGAVAIAANLTSTGSQDNGYLTAFAAGLAQPATSNLNFTTGRDIAGGALLGLSATGAVDVFASRPSHVIIDVNGYFTGVP